MGGRPCKLDEPRLRELHAAGLTDPAIARDMGVCKWTVGNWRLRLGLPANYLRPWTAKQVGEFRAMLEAGMTVRAAAARLGRTAEAGYAAVARHRLQGAAGYHDATARVGLARGLFRQGCTAAEVARRLGVSGTAARKYRKRLEGEVRKKRRALPGPACDDVWCERVGTAWAVGGLWCHAHALEFAAVVADARAATRGPPPTPRVPKVYRVRPRG